MTIDEALAEIRSVVPESWNVWAGADGGMFNQLSVIAVKGTRDGQMYGCAHQWTGYRPTAFEWKWKLVPDDWSDLDTWPDNPPDPPARDGIPGESVRVEAIVPFTYVWEKVGVAHEFFDAVAEAKPGYFAEWAAKQFVPILQG